MFDNSGAIAIHEPCYNGDIGNIDDVDSSAGEIVASFDGRSMHPMRTYHAGCETVWTLILPAILVSFGPRRLVRQKPQQCSSHVFAP
jgi:hypothetical protein